MYRRTLVVSLALGLAVAGSAQAQAYKNGYTDIGPTVGLGGLSGASLAIGGRFEHAFKQLPDMGNGVLGIMISADWWHYSNRYFGSDYGFTYIPIGGTVNYHFNVKSNQKIDPFIGLGLGYQIVSTPYDGVYDGSALYFIGRLGARYFLNSKMALYGDVGAGAAVLNAGITFGMGGGK